jgi:glycerol kinase
MSVVPVRRDGTPTGPCIMWMDTRGAANNLELLNDESFPLFLDRHGLIPLPSGRTTSPTSRCCATTTAPRTTRRTRSWSRWTT